MEYYKNLDLADIKYFCEIDQIWKTEEWRDVVSYEGIYTASDLGRVKSLSREKLNKGKYRIITKEFILKQSVGTHGYCQICLFSKESRKTFKTQRVVTRSFFNHLGGSLFIVINHKNFIRTDNRILNLEIITQRENANLKHIKSSSKYVGVGWDKQMKKWRSKIVVNGKTKFLGLFHNELEAHKAYQKALENIT